MKKILAVLCLLLILGGTVVENKGHASVDELPKLRSLSTPIDYNNLLK